MREMKYAAFLMLKWQNQLYRFEIILLKWNVLLHV